MASLLSAQHIAALCSAAASQITIEVVAETGSTNADLLARIDTLARPALLVAEMQTAGRGRAGRSWHSGSGTALTFSLAWKFSRPMHALIGLPLAVGVAMARALAASGIEVRLKWPNDVLRNHRKLAGILIETARGSDPGQSWAVIGIGLNVALPPELANRIGQPAAELPQPDIDRNKLLAQLIDSLAQAMREFDAEGLAPFVEEWNRLHAHAGQVVVISDRGQMVHEGRAKGIDSSGRLWLETAAGQVAVMAGDVSLRVRGG